VPRSEIPDRVMRTLKLVQLDALAERYSSQISGGQQQRVALARALAPGPEVVLLDEPFSNLDAALRARVRAEVREILRAAAATAVFVTHDQEEALSLADAVAVMLGGRVVQVAEPQELYRCPVSHEVATFVGDADFLPGAIADGRVSCELGILRSQSPLAGKVAVMLRPEHVDLILDRESPCRVLRREFFGHDQMVSVRLPSGGSVRARLGPEASFSPGDPVRIAVRHEVAVFAPAAPSR